MRVICHRGCPTHGPENTVEAVRQAAGHVDMVEIDVQRCGSGEIVVFHDTTLNRLTGERGAVATTPLETLRTLTVGDSEAGIPLFSSFLEAVPGDLGIDVELKHAGMTADLLEIASGADNELLFSSFVPQATAALAGSGYPLGHLFYEGWDAELDAARSLGCESLHPSADLVDADRVARAHEREFAVVPWDVTDHGTVECFREFGVDGVIVDDWCLGECG
jgi:glycerophosphoryl diester phosphodiesterase